MGVVVGRAPGRLWLCTNSSCVMSLEVSGRSTSASSLSLPGRMGNVAMGNVAIGSAPSPPPPEGFLINRVTCSWKLGPRGRYSSPGTV